jgi:hypothetical protein
MPSKDVTVQAVATQHGCKHEAEARQKYTAILSLIHQNLTVSTCGFYISTSHAFIGASPDGLVNCSCCGEGICEIKV